MQNKHVILRHAKQEELEDLVQIDRYCFSEENPGMSEEQLQNRAAMLRMNLEKEMMLSCKQGDSCIAVACNSSYPYQVMGWTSLQHNKAQNTVSIREIRAVENESYARDSLNQYLDELCADIKPAKITHIMMNGTEADVELKKKPVVLTLSSLQACRVKPQLA